MMDEMSVIGQEPEIIDDNAALELVNETYEAYKTGRSAFEREWYRNILFLLGNQWLTWDVSRSTWRKKKLQDWVPTPVTNKFSSAGQRIVSVLARIEPNWTYIPVSDTTEDIKAAELADKAEELICEENNIETIREHKASWLAYTGNCFLLSGVEPEYGEPDEFERSLAEAEGREPERPIINYKLYTDVLSPFEVMLDHTIEDFNKQRKIIVVNMRSKEYVADLYDVNPDELEEETANNYLETIGYITSDGAVSGFLGSVNKARRVAVKRFFMLPTKKYPEGLYIVTAGSKILEKSVLPKTVKGEPFIPIVHVKFDPVPGAAYGRTPMNDVAQKNVIRNQIESLIYLIIFRMAAPVWMVPRGTSLHGMNDIAPGAIIEYTQVGDKAFKPDRIPGEQIPATVVQYMAMIDKDIEDLVSTFEALKGQSPYSGAPGVVIEQLIEQGLTRFGPALRNMAFADKEWMKHQLEFFRQYGMAERTLARQGDGSTWSFEKFKGADIAGAVNVRIESDSTVPRSSHVELAKTLEAVNTQLVDVTNPMTRLKVLQKLKLADLMEDYDRDTIEATRENEAMLAGLPVSVTPFIDNHLVHIATHKKLAQSDMGRRIKDIIAKHITEHYMTMDAEMNPVSQQAPPVQEQVPNKITQEGADNLNPGEGTPVAPVPEGAI